MGVGHANANAGKTTGARHDGQPVNVRQANSCIGQQALYEARQGLVLPSRHRLARIGQDFTILDELYTNPQITDTVDPLIEADWEGKAHPMLWVRKYGKARVCYNALGHGVEAFANPALQTLLKRGAMWVLGQI